MTIYQETIQLARLAQINNFLECTYNADKYWTHLQWVFLGPENHQFRTSSSRGVAKTFFGRKLNVGYRGWQRKFWDFRLVKMITFDIVSTCIMTPPSKPKPSDFFVPTGSEKLNKSTSGRLPAQIILTCYICLMITFILISEQPANTS